ncbi:hypothetical protein GX408_14395 [bacterium]|nr:hypothetical protein [bacterium]
MRTILHKVLLCLILVLCVLLKPTLAAGSAGFSLTCKGISTSRHIFSIFVMPGETVSLRLHKIKAANEIAVRSELGCTRRSAEEVVFHAPAAAGVYPCTFYRTQPSDSIRLQVFVLTPYLGTEKLEGYQIGFYPSRVMQTLTHHAMPTGFIRVTKEMESVYLSPHFQVAQFLCKQPGDHPKFLCLQEKLLHKLELIIDHLALKGFDCPTLAILSGFRTPAYNKAIGNVPYSWHCWGGAADIFVDRDGNGNMDDLNRDGRCDLLDAEQLRDWIEAWSREPVFASLLGGLARYRRTHSHGPFVHVDVRGSAASWGE